MKQMLACSVWTVALLLAGCGGDSGPEKATVTGAVTYKNSPVADATVIFYPATGPVANGKTNAQGQYTLKTGANEGAVLGEHTVTVAAVSTSGPPPMPGTEEAKQAAENPAKSPIPEKYGDQTKTDLKVTVKAGSNEIPLELKD